MLWKVHVKKESVEIGLKYTINCNDWYDEILLCQSTKSRCCKNQSWSVYERTVFNYGVRTTRVTSELFRDFRIKCWGTLSVLWGSSEICIQLDIVACKIGEFTSKYEETFDHRSNFEAIQLLDILRWVTWRKLCSATTK